MPESRWKVKASVVIPGHWIAYRLSSLGSISNGTAARFDTWRKAMDYVDARINGYA